MDQKKFIVIIIVIVVLFSSAVAYFISARKVIVPVQPVAVQNNAPKGNTEAPVQAPQPAVAPIATPAVIDAGVVYANADFGFRINFSQDWAGYKAMFVKDPDMKGLSYIYIFMPTTDKKWPVEENKVTHEKFPGFASMFVISVWDKALWTKEISSTECKENPTPDCPFEGEVVGKSDKHIFTVSTGQAYPNDPALVKLIPGLAKGSIDGASFQDIFEKMFELVK
jgi:hypothetical protein